MNYAPQFVFDALQQSKWGNPLVYGEPVFLLYNVLDSLPSYYGPPGSANYRPGFAAVNPEQEAAILSSLALWSSVANITFQEASSPEISQLTFGQSEIPPDVVRGLIAANTFQPDAFGLFAGDVWLNKNYTPMQSPAAGEFAFAAITHEIGHALGLRHPVGLDFASSDFETIMSGTAHDPDTPTFSGSRCWHPTYRCSSSEQYPCLRSRSRSPRPSKRPRAVERSCSD